MSEQETNTEETKERKSRMSIVTKKNMEANEKKMSEVRFKIIGSASEEERKQLSNGNAKVNYQTGQIVRI